MQHMPPRLPRISGEEAITVSRRPGFTVSRQRGGHVILKKRISNSEEIGCVVPLHHELAIGTLRNILRQARVSPEEFIENL